MSALAEHLRITMAERAGESAPFSGDTVSATIVTDTAAAVLIALTDRARPGVILTQRPDTMRRHAGQVAFPGGCVDPADADDIAAALREAEEEIGISPSAVELVGTLSHYRTVTGFRILPVVGVIPPDLSLVPHDVEVAAVFEVPLDFLADPSNVIERWVMFEGSLRRYSEILWEDRRIWGATAAMLANLVHRLR